MANWVIMTLWRRRVLPLSPLVGMSSSNPILQKKKKTPLLSLMRRETLLPLPRNMCRAKLLPLIFLELPKVSHPTVLAVKTALFYAGTVDTTFVLTIV